MNQRDMAATSEITILLAGMRAGNQECHSRFVAAVYSELKQMARTRMRSENAGHSLQPSDLVNEVYVRLIGRDGADWQNRAHFFSAAASTMRRILIDRARSRKAKKREGDLKRVDFDQIPEAGALDADGDRLILLDSALEELSKFDPRQAKIVEMRFFAGMTFEEVADVLQLSSRTVKRDWAIARAWLQSKTSALAAG